METINNSNEQKCPYHSLHNSLEENDDPRKDANTGDWEDERDDSGTDPNRYDPDKYEEDSNDNSGGAGSTGSNATNSQEQTRE